MTTDKSKWNNFITLFKEQFIAKDEVVKEEVEVTLSKDLEVKDVADNNTLTISPPIPFIIDEKSIFWFVAETDTNNTAVRGRFSGELHRNKDT